MKNLLLLFIIISLSASAFSQEIPEKANTITISMADSITANEKVLKVLESKDYAVKRSGSTIHAGPKTLKNNTRVSMTVQIKGSEVILKGMILIATQGSLPIQFKGNKGTNSMIAWEEMDKIAKALGGKLKYE